MRALGLALLLFVGCGAQAGSPAGADLSGGTLADLRGGGVADGGSADAGGGGGDGGSPGDDQTPPIGSAAELERWLAAGSYKGWPCEAAPHPARVGSAHSANRICNNRALSGSQSGDYPVGAASVKELFDGGGQVVGYAVGLRTRAGSGAWFWYERVGATTYANSLDAGLCSGCHRGAPRDNIFTQVR